MLKNNYRILLLFFLLFPQFVIAQTAPIAVNDDYVAEINTELNIASPGILTNDTDTDGDALTVTEFSIDEVSYATGQTATFTKGAITINADGGFSFTPATDYSGNISVTYTISDGTFTSSASLLLVVQQTPEAVDDSYTAEINTPLIIPTLGVLGNDTDADGDALTVTGFSVNAMNYTTGQIATFTEGSITINADGSFSFIPATGYTGDVPVITYTISDGTFTSSANLSLTVEQAPVAQDDNYSTEINTTLDIAASGILGNDTDADGDALVVTEFFVGGTLYTANETATFDEGTITINEDGSFSFTPIGGYMGNVPTTITYCISDGTFTSCANLFLTVEQAPVAVDDYDTVEIGTELIVDAPGVLANDIDDDPLRVTEFSVGGNTVNANGMITIPGQGSITIRSSGSFAFIPNTGYTGNVSTIRYCISDGTFTSCANLYLTVEPITDLLEISGLTSCNQGYTIDGEYKIRYDISLRNISTARDYHPSNLIENIDLTNDLDAIYGVGCVIGIDEFSILMTEVTDYIGNPYPLEFDDNSRNPNFSNATSSSIFNDDAINNATLYPRQTINIQFCVTVNPFCNGRPNPTPSGSNINFNSVFDVTATTTLENTTTIINHNDTANLLLTDFHTTEAVVAAGLYIPENIPTVNTDGTYDFRNTVIITNESTATTTTNVNYNMGLGDFLDSGVTFDDLRVTQISGPPVTVNGSYNGDTATQLLEPNNSLGAGETIILQIDYIVAPFSLDDPNNFNQLTPSQTQGALDGFDESTPENRRLYSFVTWSDVLGDHLDRYYPTSSPTQTVSSRLQCICETSDMTFSFPSSSTTNKTIIAPIDTIPEGILEHEEITFQITITNTSPIVELDNLQLQDDLNSICSGNIVSVSTPIIQNSTATTDPILNPNYDGTTVTNIFNGTSGVLEPNQFITVQFTVLFIEDCIGTNRANFSATNPAGSSVNSSRSVSVNAFTDTDNDGITNFNDLDDDNDTIPDIEEYNGLDPLNKLNPLDDNDNDFIPNYRDTDYGVDANSDGIIDIFDFDNDGIPNHFDLDSDNDGIFDVVEVGNSPVDTNRNGRTNNPVGANGLDNTLETDDTFNASITYPILNADNNNNNDDENPNFIDIDADGDGIVDNIEGQTTTDYNPPNGVVGIAGIDTAYPNGITPVDTDSDTTPDYIDTNSDDDYRLDNIEGWDFNNDGTPETIASNIDADGDGLDDAFDTDDNLINPTNGQVPTDFPNADIPETPERDWREEIGIVVIIDDVSKKEGRNLAFTISLVTRDDHSILVESTTPIDINFSITDPNPIAVTDASFYDYTIQNSSTLTIPALTSTATFNVFAVDDTIDELDELFTLNGIITSGNTINTEIVGIGTILDNDDPPSILMNDSRAIEGDNLEHTITLSNPSSRPIQIEVRTEDVTATNPYDYTFNPDFITLTIDGTIDPNNANTQVSFPISTIDDTIDEPEETLNVIGIVTSGNVRGQDLAKTGTIEDNDDPPSITMNNSRADEGVDLIHTITLSHPSSTPILISVDVSDGTATSPDDYTFDPNPRNFTIDATVDPADPQLETVPFPIPTNTDDINEPDEVLNVIGTVTSGNVGTQDLTKTGTIIDINPDAMVVIDDVTVVEGNTLVFTITLLDENSELVQNSFPVNLDLEAIDGTATSGQDFEMLLTSTSIPPLTSSITQSVQTIDDRLNEDTETMQLQVTIQSTGVTNSSPFVFGTGTIKDNDVPNLFSPNGDGRSDVFKILGIEDFPNFKLIIIDRWGSEVYNYSNNGNTNPIWWDGTYKGKPVIEGVYFYTLDFNDGSTPPQTNFIQLIR